MVFRWRPCGDPGDEISPTQPNLTISNLYPRIHGLRVHLILFHSRTTLVRRDGKFSDGFIGDYFAFARSSIHSYIRRMPLTSAPGPSICGKSAL